MQLTKEDLNFFKDVKASILDCKAVSKNNEKASDRLLKNLKDLGYGFAMNAMMEGCGNFYVSLYQRENGTYVPAYFIESALKNPTVCLLCHYKNPGIINVYDLEKEQCIIQCALDVDKTVGTASMIFEGLTDDSIEALEEDCCKGYNILEGMQEAYEYQRELNSEIYFFHIISKNSDSIEGGYNFDIHVDVSLDRKHVCVFSNDKLDERTFAFLQDSFLPCLKKLQWPLMLKGKMNNEFKRLNKDTEVNATIINYSLDSTNGLNRSIFYEQERKDVDNEIEELEKRLPLLKKESKYLKMAGKVDTNIGIYDGADLSKQ